jgi:type II secretory pathway pseudopilin PulG
MSLRLYTHAPPRGPRRRLRRDESGQMLIELLIALTLLAVAVGALITVFSASIFSLRHASIEGNATTIADNQMENYKTLPYASLKLNAATIPGAGNAYVSSPPNNLTSGQAASITSGQITGGSLTASQSVTGPDNRSYQVDTYIFANAPTGGENILQITVAVRKVSGSTVGAIMGQASSAFDLASTRVAS